GGGGVDTSKERYSLNWNGKSEARQRAQEVSTGTLRPAKKESKNWDNTENIYIEGDNLEVLKLLQKSYYGKIKMIYIDPPYNTGNDILYKNNFTSPLEYYKRFIGEISDDNFVLTTNSDTSGRYHSDWLSMMFPVLKLGRNLLSNDGIIVIAIDDYEQSRLRMMCDEIFGEYNFIGTIVTRCNPQGRGKKNIDPVHEYHLIYSKNVKNMKELRIKNNKEGNFKKLIRTGTNSRKEERPKRFYPILVKNKKVEMITIEEYQKIYSKETGFNEEYIKKLREKYEKEGNLVIFPIAKNGEKKVWQREFDRVLKEYHTYIYKDNQIKYPSDKKRTPTSLWDENLYSNVSYGTNILKNLFNQEETFDYPKSIYTVKDFISMVNDGYILDFFSGSSTTAHAVMQLNAEEEQNKKFILIQLPQKISKDKNAYSLGYKNICEIGKERIRRAGDKIKEDETLPLENREKLDIGFKVFKLDSSNIKEWDTDTNDLQQSLLDSVENIKSDRNSLDVLYEILLKYGLDLNIPIKETENFYSIGGGTLLVSLNNEINLDVINSICEEYKKILEIDKEFKTTVILKDNSFKSDVDKTNALKRLEQVGISEIRSI
ncbi:site-specific DNA-methyltransferase, partial [Leptotrichia hongkongensis]